MDTKVTKEWGYKVTSPTSLIFYHALLPQVGIDFLRRDLRFYKEIVFNRDKTVVIFTESPMDLSLLISELNSMLKNMEALFAVTDNFSYKLSWDDKKFLKHWSLGVEAGIALITIAQSPKLKLSPYDFELINSQIGGIYMHPFTILFYETHAKVIQPIEATNFFQREQIERNIAVSMRGILQRVSQAQEGYEGLALLSYIEEKTQLSPRLIARIIEEKTRSIKPPKHSPLFSAF